MAATPEQIASYVRSHPAFMPFAPRPSYPAGIWVAGAMPQQTAPELADQFLEDAGFAALELGGFLSTPDGELIAEGVELALPTADRRIVSLAVDALKLAASKEGELTPLQLGGLVAGGLVLLLLIAAS